jgi:hypothetical protein
MFFTQAVTALAGDGVGGEALPGQHFIRVQHAKAATWTVDAEDDYASPEAEVAALTRAVVAARAVRARVLIRGIINEPGKPMKAPCEQTAAEILETLEQFRDAWTLAPTLQDLDHDDAGGGRHQQVVPPPLAPVTAFSILDTGITTDDGRPLLSESSTPEALEDAARVLYKLFSDVEVMGREYGILGHGTDLTILRTQDFHRTLLRVVLAYSSARAQVNLHASRAPDYDYKRVNFGGYSVVGAAAKKGGKVTDMVRMTDTLLHHCAVRRLRHCDNMVYVEQCVAPAADIRWGARACTAPGCTAVGPGVMYTAVGAPAHTMWCFEHAAEAIREGVDRVVNAMFQTGATWGASAEMRRTATARRPRWLLPHWTSATRTATKTWVPDMGRGSPSSLAPGGGGVPGADPAAIARDLGANVRPRTCEDLVRDVLDCRLEQRENWETLVGNRTLPHQLQEYLAKTKDPAFPKHEPHPTLFAFNNGMYSIIENRFCSFDALPPEWELRGALNFLPEHFDPIWTVQPLDCLGVPGYDDITRTQGYAADTIAYLDAFLGRLLLPLSTFDTWQMALVFLGTAGSGKSTIARAVALLVREQNVGNLPSNCEEQWAVATLVGKVCVMCTEMKQDFRLPNSVLQCMIAGDPVTVHEKFKTAYEKSPWTTQVMLVGNVMPAAWYADEGNPMLRRAMIFNANVKPSTQDPSIQARFFENLGPFLVRISRRYRELVDRVKASEAAGDKCHVRDFMPAQVVAFHNAFKNETSTAAVFLDHILPMYDLGFRDDGNASSSMDLVRDADLVQLFRFLREARAAAAPNSPRFPTVLLNEAVKQAVDALQAQDDDDGGPARGRGRQGLTQQGLRTYAVDMRVPFREIQALYTQWWKDTSVGAGLAGTRGKAAPNFQHMLSEIGLPVSVDMDHSPSEKFIFGLSRKANAGTGNSIGGVPGHGGSSALGSHPTVPTAFDF